MFYEEEGEAIPTRRTGVRKKKRRTQQRRNAGGGKQEDRGKFARESEGVRFQNDVKNRLKIWAPSARLTATVEDDLHEVFML